MMAISAIFHDVGMSVPETESSLEISQQNEIRKKSIVFNINAIINEKYDYDIFQEDEE